MRNASSRVGPRDDWPPPGRRLLAVRIEHDSRHCHVFSARGSRVIQNANGGDGEREFVFVKWLRADQFSRPARGQWIRSVVELCKGQGASP